MTCNFSQGQLLLIDKPQGWTSFDVVAKIRNLIKKHTGEKVKVGHAGTLDPLATGLLIIATGKKTKTLNQLQGLDKEYIAEIRFGANTSTYDAESEIIETFPVDHLTENLVKQTILSFLGKQKQIPPRYSAKKIKGKKAYDLARKGEDFKLEPVDVEFKEIDILTMDLPDYVVVRLLVSKGTYIRSFAYDLGKKLGSGAYLSALRRTKTGDFNVNDALTINQFEKNISICSNN